MRKSLKARRLNGLSTIRILALGVLLSVSSSAFAQELFFQIPKPENCSGDGVRQWSAIIDGRGYFGDWVEACK